MSEEPDNADRASWAQAGVEAYAAETRFDPREQVIVKGDQDDKDHAEEVISDLLCDMHHLTDSLGIDWEAMLERAAMHHRDDVAEEKRRAEQDAEEEADEERHFPRCRVCSEPIQRDYMGKTWIHRHGDAYCGTGDGATALPPEVPQTTTDEILALLEPTWGSEGK